MIWLWPKHRPGQAQFVYFYQHAYPHLRHRRLRSEHRAPRSALVKIQAQIKKATEKIKRIEQSGEVEAEYAFVRGNLVAGYF